MLFTSKFPDPQILFSNYSLRIKELKTILAEGYVCFRHVPQFLIFVVILIN